MNGELNPTIPAKSQAVSGDVRVEPMSRGTALLISIISFVAVALVGFQLLVIFGFSSIVDPSLPEPDRRQLAAKQFLFGDGPFQIIYVSTFAAITFVSLISGLTHLSYVVFRRPDLRRAKIWSIGLGLLLTVGFVGFFFVRCF